MAYDLYTTTKHKSGTLLATLCVNITIVACSSMKPTLTVDKTCALENEDVKLTCAVNSSYSRWENTIDSKEYGLIYHENNTCLARGFILQNSSSFGYSCDTDTSLYKFTLTLENIQLSQNNDTWYCSDPYQKVYSDVLVIKVSVLVKNVELQSDGKVVSTSLIFGENGTTGVSCTSSFSLPRANITWYIINRTNNEQLYLEDANVTYTSNDELISTTSTIYVQFNRTYNGWNFGCKAENILGYEPVSKNVTLNITYPTDNPNILCSNNGVYKVIKNRESNLTCSVEGGNPAGILHWNCTGNITHQRGPNSNVSQTIVWTATQTQYCTCSSTNIAGTRSTFVYIDVLYPPVLSDIQNQTVFEGDSVILQCDVIRANPPVYMTRWTSNKHNVSGTTLSLPNVTRYDDMIYTCTVYNTMDPSCHHVVQGNMSKSVHLEILYPPSINITSGKKFKVKEGDTFKYTCPVVPGNPTSTNVTWKRSNDTKIWTSSELLIHNVSRYDDSVYTCYVTNVMVNSNGTTKLGQASEDIRLIVQYRASVTYFHVRNYPDNTSVVVMEHTQLTFECRVQGNPTADVKIYEFENEVISSNTNKLLYDTTATCSGKPVLYSCHGNNALNNKPSTIEVQILVRCKPRPDPNANIQYNKTSAINHTVTLSYTALAYPHPTFIWYRHGSSIDINDPRTIISSSNLQTNLTISHVEENDFGQYVVNATNDVGSNISYMYLNPQGVPEVPTNLKQINSTTTESIITLDWTPGFNNGLEQKFTLMYRKHPNGTWQSTNVTDTGEQNIRHNITGLIQDTTYEGILFAFNDLGRSRSNVTLFCRTKAELIGKSTEESSSSAIIGAVGGSAAVVLILGVIIGITIFKRRSQNKKSNGNQSNTIPSRTSAVYANVGNDQKTLLKKDKNPTEVQFDITVYENAELGTKKSPMNVVDTSNHEGEYVNYSIKKSKTPAKTNDELPMKTMPSDVKAWTKKTPPSNLPPSVPAKTDFSNILTKVDDVDDDGHATNIVVNGDENIYNNSTEKIEHIENVYVQELFDFVAGKSFQSFAAEFLILPKGLTMPCTVAVKPENIKLNRYNGIFPYDHSRVIIPDDPDFFMNACYVDGFKNEKGYIASLGPTADTSGGFKTFWKMVWHEQSDIIVMLTNLREISGMKCEQYWPKLGPAKVYGEVTVTCTNVESFAEYTVRTFNVSNGGQTRTLTQLHFTAWPDKGVPDDLTSLLEFRQRMRCAPSLGRGRIIVHCSAGIGRTGTLIALDRLIAEGKTTKSINVSTCIRSMRQQRVNMVQTPEQYVYIYKACVYALAYESECIPADTFRDNLKKTTDAMFGEVFNKLKPMVDNESDQEKVAIKSNGQEKSNRPKAEVAGDKYRVRLYIDKNSEESDYINAVYINSFKTKNKFIAAQSPMKNFVQDFICMIYQEQCICVVDMDEKISTKMDVGTYMPPANQALTFGGFKITTTRLDDNPKYTVNKVKIENTGKVYQGEWTTYHFKYHDWKHNKETPGEPGDFVEFLKEVEEYATQFGEKESQVLVHCMDGSAKSGLFCFVACLLEKVECERQVNIGNTLRQVRTRRKTVIKSPNQLKFCYKTVDAFIDMNKAK